MPRGYRLCLFYDDLASPMVLEIHGAAGDLRARMKIIFALDLLVSRAEIWEGSALILNLSQDAVAAFRGLSEATTVSRMALKTVH